MTRNETAADIVEAFSRAGAKELAKKPLLVGDRTSTYAQVLDRAARLNRLFADRGLSQGDRAIVATADDHAAVTIILAMLRAGIAAMVVDPRTGPGRFATLREIAAPSAVFVDRDRLAAWGLESGPAVVAIDAPGAGKPSLFAKLLGAGGRPAARDAYPGLVDSLEPLEPPPRIDPETDAYVLFTSGTTSTPKGVRISHRALFAHLETLGRQFSYDGDARLLNLLRLHHADGLVHGPICSFAHGATSVRPFEFEVQRVGDFVDALYRHRATHMVVVPTMLSLISHLGDDYRDGFRTEDLRAVICSASMLDPGLWRSFQERFGVRVSNIYGLTETVVGGLFSGPSDEDFRIGTVGKPADCEARIVDENGAEVPVGKTGELLLRGELLFSGYLNAPEATAEVLRDGWLATGDFFSRDRDGFYRILGRKKLLIITAGANVQPEEVNQALNASPDVAEAATFGEPDDTFGEIVVSCVVAAPGREPSAAKLADHCRQLLDPEKVPARIHVLDSLPRTVSGKVPIAELRAQIARLADSSASDPSDGIGEQVLALASRCFNTDRKALSLHSRPEDVLGWHSLSHLELIAAIEKRFTIEFSTAEIMRVESLSDAVEIASAKIEGA